MLARLPAAVFRFGSLGIVCALTVAFGAVANAQEKPHTLTLAGTMDVASIDCGAQSLETIRIAGAVTLVHPNDRDHTAAPLQITIVCDNIVFEPSGLISSSSSLVINARKQLVGFVHVANTRGRVGGDAPATLELWARRTAGPGSSGGGGNRGRDAETSIKTRICGWPPHPCVDVTDHGSDRGGNGSCGGRGADGAAGQQGANGRNALSAGHIVIRAPTANQVTGWRVSAVGGGGGRGGKGGRGIDGGAGGRGGSGGNGGNGNAKHGGSSGGDGGCGGSGGNGGAGGNGGDGGNGGNGGNVFIYILDGSLAPNSPLVENLGGQGGLGGVPGDPGQGGTPGSGGSAGCGGARGRFAGIATTGGGSCGTNGRSGPHGNAGGSGRPGDTGKPGRPGNVGVLRIETVEPRSLNDVLN